jgi:glycosyltransferase involved in cell wall biosynthesis
MKLISVIIPAHNVEKYIENCLISVFDQTYKNIEVILIDDFSTDKTVKIAKSFQKNHSNLKIISLKNYGSKKKSGISMARNLGIKFAKGKFIALLDADDLWSKEKLDLQVKLIKNKILCFTNVKYLYEDPRDILQKNIRSLINFISKSFFIKHLSFINNISPSSVLIKKDVFIHLKFGMDFESQGIEDIDMWLRIDRKYPDSFVYLNKQVTTILRRKGSVSSSYLVQYVRAIQLYAKNFLLTKNYKDFNKFLIGTIIRFIFLFLKTNYKKIKIITITIIFILTSIYFLMFKSPIIYYINQNLSHYDDLKKSDLIVVFTGFGSLEYFNNTYQLRYKETSELYNKKSSENILIYGRDSIIPEAQIIKSLLINNGIKNENINVIDDNGAEFKNTYDLIVSINKLVSGQNINSIILVASPEHLLRLKSIWKKINPKIEVLCFKSKNIYGDEKYNHNFEKVYITIRELVTLTYYKLLYKI